MIKDYYKAIAGIDLSAVEIGSNFHTHNYLCGHAGGTVTDYAAEAVSHGMKRLGISDHCIAPFGYTVPLLDKADFFAQYLPQFDAARKRFGDKLELFVGVETEYFDGHDEFYRYLTERTDYIVLGQHEFSSGKTAVNSYCCGSDEQSILAYFQSVRKGIASGYFSVLAHPDLIFYGRPVITDRIATEFDAMIADAVSAGLAVELNANGIRYHEFRYPTDLLVDSCIKHDAKVVVSADAHSPDALCDDCTAGLTAYARIKRLNSVDRIN